MSLSIPESVVTLTGWENEASQVQVWPDNTGQAVARKERRWAIHLELQYVAAVILRFIGLEGGSLPRQSPIGLLLSQPLTG